MNESRSFSFGAYEMKKTLKGLGIAVVGAVLSYLLKEVIPFFEDTSYAVLVPMMSVLINAMKEFVVDNSTRR